MKKPLGLSVFSSCRLSDPAHVERVVRLLLSYGGDFVPTRFGVHEPLKESFSERSIGDLASSVSQGFLYWQSPKTFAMVTQHRPGYMHGSFDLSMAEGISSSANLARLLCDVASEVQADLGSLHLLNEHDREFDTEKGSRIDGADQSSFSLIPKKLANGLPDFYWAMVFGKPYCDMFGIERLLATPAHSVKRLGESLVYVQLTADVNDCERDHAAVLRARQFAKRHLGLEAFMPDQRDGLAGKVGHLPLVGKLIGRRPLVPVLRP
jgi:hypothetical protein